MVRNYIRKTNRGSWNEKNIQLAITAVKWKKLSLTKPSTAYSVLKVFLNRRVNNTLKTLPIDQPSKPILRHIVNIIWRSREATCILLYKNGFCILWLANQELQVIVFDYVEKNNIKYPFNVEETRAGRHFITAFLGGKNILSVPKPESVSLNRVFELNKSAVDRYFDNLEKVTNEHQLEPHRIFNCDESGLICVHKPLKLIAQKCKNVVSSITSTERGKKLPFY